MTESQFCAWLLFALPMLAFFGNETMTFNQQLFGALIFSIILITLFIIGEKEFIKDCKKGYVTFEDSIFPMWFYRRIKSQKEFNKIDDGIKGWR